MISPESWRKIDERKELTIAVEVTSSVILKERKITEYSKKDREVEMCLRRYKREWVDGIAREKKLKGSKGTEKHRSED